MASVFISYSSGDKMFAKRLVADLEDSHIRVWIDESTLELGDSVPDTIAKGIEEADCIILILSHNSVASSWVNRELQIALEKERSVGHPLILPIRIDRCIPPHELSSRLYADVLSERDYDAVLDILVGSIREHAAWPKSIRLSAEELNIIETLESFVRDDRLLEYREECAEAEAFINDVSRKYPGRYDSYVRQLYNSARGIPTFKAGRINTAGAEAIRFDCNDLNRRVKHARTQEHERLSHLQEDLLSILDNQINTLMKLCATRGAESVTLSWRRRGWSYCFSFDCSDDTGTASDALNRFAQEYEAEIKPGDIISTIVRHYRDHGLEVYTSTDYIIFRWGGEIRKTDGSE
jgi:hypothetical protein